MEYLLILAPLVLFFLLFNAQRKRNRLTAAMQEQVTPGTAICTTAGLFGTVVSLTDKEFVLEAAPGVHLRFDRRAIGLVVPSEQPADPADPADHHDPSETDHPGGHDHPA